MQNITPGRIGNVFFFPSPSFAILKGKPPLWGQVTSFGRYEKFLTKGMLREPKSKVGKVENHDIIMGFIGDKEDEQSDMDISDIDN